jgi:hypothetical protein
LEGTLRRVRHEHRELFTNDGKARGARWALR